MISRESVDAGAFFSNLSAMHAEDNEHHRFVSSYRWYFSTKSVFKNDRVWKMSFGESHSSTRPACLCLYLSDGVTYKNKYWQLTTIVFILTNTVTTICHFAPSLNLILLWKG